MAAPGPRALIDEVDAADEKIGRIRRVDALVKARGFRVVHVLVFNRNGELLLQKLGRHRERNPLRWGSSVAGYLRAGESYLHAARRRLREEIGLTTILKKHGSIAMNDQEAIKFITVYTTQAAHPSIRESEHIEALEFWPWQKVSRSLARTPDIFTKTFRHVFRFNSATRDLCDFK